MFPSLDVQQNFKWEEQNYVVQNEINNLAFLVNNDKVSKVYLILKTISVITIGISLSQIVTEFTYLLSNTQFSHEKRKMKRKGDRYSTQTSLIVASMKRLVPVGLRVCFPCNQDLITLAKNGFSQVSWKCGQY